MPGQSSLALRMILAGGLFLALLTLSFTFPAIMAGDMQAFAELLQIGAALSFALLIGVMMFLLPLLILFGVIRVEMPGARMAMALGGGIGAFALAQFGLGGESGDLSSAAVALIALAGAIAGWAFGARWRKPE